MESAIFAVGDIIDGKYQVQAVLPAGGSGRVYKVYDSIFDRIYALKVFNDTAVSLDWLKREARPLLELHHPNIVQVRTFSGTLRGRVYLVSEFVEEGGRPGALHGWRQTHACPPGGGMCDPTALCSRSYPSTVCGPH